MLKLPIHLFYRLTMNQEIEFLSAFCLIKTKLETAEIEDEYLLTLYILKAIIMTDMTDAEHARHARVCWTTSYFE